MSGRDDLIQYRQGSAALWAEVNPILDEGEPGWTKDTKVLKVGDGFTPWNDLEAALGDDTEVQTVPLGTPLPEGVPDGTLWVEYAP